MKFLKSHFALSRSQQNGIFVLVGLIILVQILIFSMNFYPGESDPVEDERIADFRKKLDSLKIADRKLTDTIYPFNPNFISDFKGYQLGMSIEEIDRILDHRKKNKWVNSAKEFQEVTGISDSLLNSISPYFRFPEWTQKSEVYRDSKVITSANKSGFTDLNLADANDLARIRGIGEVLSNRIVKYRTSIGGFRDEIQLGDVYGLSEEVIAGIKEEFKILSRPSFELMNLNTITVSELAEIPYFSQSMAKKIISYRNLRESVSSFEELSKIEGFPSDKIDKIKLYLVID
ncbi:helix-hairpin-helix domain-containing protein [Christiangramia salexigens]|uniref:Helix-hairpin-helix DNA-binding motif class 1 domain-containing protein n=1 Tax=Christiangramia salexigens TaxID=1913577 RepID=A0A1L3J4L8_9FLAO|nr:helix-hairpin-helix domain-containing protein [Christiangramia salexigens]APG60071.1 hypothetical protein LPB144_06425 [Christiangramia salexigens]